METNNVNQNVKELTDEQLKQVAGGIGPQELCPLILGCKTMSPTTCECQECEDGWIFKKSSSGGQECVLNQGGAGISVN